MKNSVQTGEVLTLTSTNAVVAGVPEAFGDLVVIPRSTSAANLPVAYDSEGVFEVEKATGNAADAMTVGKLVYWDQATKKATGVSASMKQMGFAVRADAQANTKCLVKLSRP